MAEIIVQSRFVRMAPDKIRLLGKALVNKNAEDSLNRLAFIRKTAAKPLILAVKEGLSRARTGDIAVANLLIKTIIVNEGPKLKRRRIISRGRATNILKRMSHITVVLSADGNTKSQITNAKQIANKQKNKIKK